MANEKGCTPAQGEDVIPIPGTKRRTYLRQNKAALDVQLSSAALEGLENIVPHSAGTRSPDHLMDRFGR